MAGCETSFDSYTFTFEWRVSDLETRLLNSDTSKFNSPTFSSPSGAKPATTWMLTIFNGDQCAQTPPPPVGEQSLSVELRRLSTVGAASSGPIVVSVTCNSGIGRPVRPQQTVVLPRERDDVWVEARLKTRSSNFDDLTERFEATSVSQGPTKLSQCLPKSKVSGFSFGSISEANVVSTISGDPSVITFKQYLPLFKVQDSQSIMFECEIKVSYKEPPLPNNFSLSKFMEEARQNDLFTDVTLVANGKEFKAHKVILASQSQFFKTRFSGRWESKTADDTSDERVEMIDVPVVAMDAILSYVYTGKVADIEKIAYQLLPVAEEYGIAGLQKMCEEELINSLTTSTVISTLIHATTHNALNLKKVCIEFIVSNTAAVRKSEGWSMLKKDQTHHDLWVELLESIAENH